MAIKVFPLKNANLQVDGKKWKIKRIFQVGSEIRVEYDECITPDNELFMYPFDKLEVEDKIGES